MGPLDRFERGIERILESFNLRFTEKKPLSVSPSFLPMRGYALHCPLQDSYSIAVLTRVTHNETKEGISDFFIHQGKSAGNFNICEMSLISGGLISLENSFFDFHKTDKRGMEQLGVDPSLLQLLKAAPRKIVNIGNNSVEFTNAKKADAIRRMVLADFLYEDLYRFDKCDFQKCENEFMGRLSQYFSLFSKKLGFED